MEYPLVVERAGSVGVGVYYAARWYKGRIMAVATAASS